MPDYDYQCKDCARTFTLHQMISEHEKTPHPACPVCKSTNVEQLLSSTTVITSRKS